MGFGRNKQQTKAAYGSQDVPTPGPPPVQAPELIYNQQAQSDEVLGGQISELIGGNLGSGENMDLQRLLETLREHLERQQRQSDEMIQRQIGDQQRQIDQLSKATVENKDALNSFIDQTNAYHFIGICKYNYLEKQECMQNKEFICGWVPQMEMCGVN